MNVRKIGSVALSLLIASSLIAGCGGNGGNTTSNNSTASGKNTDSNKKSDEVIHLKFWGGVPEEWGPVEAIENWNKENPDIQVEYVRFVNDDAGNVKLDTALMTGQDVDLYGTYNFARFQSRAQSGLSVDLSEFDDYNIDEKMGPNAADWKVDGKYYAMPTKRDLHFVWLNKDALDEVGLSVPYDWTWSDMQEYAKKLSGVKEWGIVQDLATWDFVLDSPIVEEGLVAADGTSNLDNQDTRKILETTYNMMYEDKSRPMYGEQMASKMRVEDEFLKGNAGMFYAGEWIFRFANNLKDYPRDFKIAIAPIPKVVADQPNHYVFGGLGDAIAINPKSKNVEAAWKFLKWYADGGMLPLAKGGRLPASSAVSTEESMKLLLDGVEDLYDMDSINKVMFGNDFKTFQNKLPQQIIDTRRNEFQLYFTNDQTLDQMMANVVKAHNEYLKQNK